MYTVNTVYTMHHHSNLIKSTKIQALGTLKIPFDIVFDALFPTVGITQINLYTNVIFYNYGHNSGQKCIPDMILTAFDI